MGQIHKYQSKTIKILEDTCVNLKNYNFGSKNIFLKRAQARNPTEKLSLYNVTLTVYSTWTSKIDQLFTACNKNKVQK